jgi:hypothetical protein
MLTQRKVSSQATVWLFIALTIILSQTLAYTQGISHVLVIVGANPTAPGFSRPQQLVAVTQNSHTNIADLSGALIFGKDDSTLSLLMPVNALKQWRLLAIDRSTAAIIADIKLSDVMAALRIQPVVQLMVIESEDSVVYFPTFDLSDPHSFGFAEANWKTAQVQIHSHPYENLNLPSEFLSIPSGFAIRFMDSTKSPPKSTVALFNNSGQKLRLLPLTDKYGENSGTSQVVFVPTIGLIEYRNGGLFCLTDASLSTNSTSQERIPISDVNSEILVRTIDGKPCLIWGEEKSGSSSRYGIISEIVIFDLNSKRELLRKPLGTSTATFQPNGSGSKIYFVDLKDGKIRFLDTGTQIIAPFSDEPIQNPAGAVILDAY